MGGPLPNLEQGVRMNLDRFSQGPDDPQDTVRRWVGEVTFTRTIRITADDNCYSEYDAANVALDRMLDMYDWTTDMDGELVDAREP